MLICFREREERAYISAAGWSLSEKQNKITRQRVHCHTGNNSVDGFTH